MDVLTVIALGLVGLLFGSFANVVIYRVPAGRSIVRPPSACGTCGAPIAAKDNIPVLSWLALRGRCRSCGARISPRYPFVELLTAALFALSAALIEPATDLIAYLPLMWVLVVLTFIDLDHKLLPNKIVVPSIVGGLILFGVTAAIAGDGGAWVRAAGSGAGAFVAFLLLAVIAPRGMGMGDVKLAALLGMALGYRGADGIESAALVFAGFFLAFLLGAVGGGALLLLKRGGGKTQVPFGPFLAMGTVLGLVAGKQLVTYWIGP